MRRAGFESRGGAADRPAALANPPSSSAPAWASRAFEKVQSGIKNFSLHIYLPYPLPKNIIILSVYSMVHYSMHLGGMLPCDNRAIL